MSKNSRVSFRKLMVTSIKNINGIPCLCIWSHSLLAKNGNRHIENVKRVLPLNTANLLDK